MLDRGEPILWRDLYDGEVMMSVKDASPYNLDVSDDSIFTDIVRSFHSNNGWTIPEDAIIVTGLGSTGVLMGLIHAFGSSYYSKPVTYPYYRPMVDMMNYPWTTNPHVEIITNPNNPDGSIQSPSTYADVIIWDMAYAWPWYGYDHKSMVNRSLSSGRHNVLVFSCSKSIGLGGARVGYGIIPMSVIRSYPNLLDRYIDYTTIASQGVDTPGQKIASSIMSSIHSFPMIRSILLTRYDEVSSLLKHLGISILSPRGFYYMWIYQKDVNLYEALPFKGVDGVAFGATSEYVRLNMCCSIETYKRMILLLKGVKAPIKDAYVHRY